ncbi:MAG: hypothetical protein ACLPJH_02430 [Myxococcaceae bacterium]
MPEPSADSGDAGLHHQLAFLAQLLEAVEQTPTAGLWKFGPLPDGSRFDLVAGAGRLRFVAGGSEEERLGTQLERLYPEMGRLLPDALQRARAERRPLGEVLIETGGPRAEMAVRTALKAQVVKRLLHLASRTPPGVEAHFEALRGAVDPRLTFGAFEAYLACARALTPAPLDVAHRAAADIGSRARTSVVVLQERAGGPEVVLSALGLTPASFDGLERSLRDLAALVRPGGEPGDPLQLAAVGMPRHWRVAVAGPACAALLEDVDDETSASLLARVLERAPAPADGGLRSLTLEASAPALAHTLEAAAADVPGCLAAGLVHLPTGEVQSAFLAEEGAGLRLARGATVASGLLGSAPPGPGTSGPADEGWALTRRGLFLVFPLVPGGEQALVLACRRATNVGVALALGRQWRARVGDHAR